MGEPDWPEVEAWLAALDEAAAPAWQRAVDLSRSGDHRALAELVRHHDRAAIPVDARTYIAGLIASAPRPRGRPTSNPVHALLRARRVCAFYEDALSRLQAGLPVLAPPEDQIEDGRPDDVQVLQVRGLACAESASGLAEALTMKRFGLRRSALRAMIARHRVG